jgi:prevent-host-death family protein
VGIRELKNSLSRYLARVRGGETIVVTDRGRAVARIIPAGLPEHLAKLLAEGRATWSGGRVEIRGRRPKPRGGLVSTYVSEDRR